MCVGSRNFEQKFLLYWQLSLILSYDVEVLVFYSVQLSFWIMIEEQALLLQKIISAQNGTCSFIFFNMPIFIGLDLTIMTRSLS